MAILSCTLFLPIKPMEVLAIVVSTHVEGLEKPIIPKSIPLIIPKIGVGVEVTLINIVTHASKVFKIPNTILKDTLVLERPKFQLIILTKPIDTISEQLVGDLTAKVKQVVLGD